MTKITKKTLIVFMMASLVFISFVNPALAQGKTVADKEGAEEMIFDILLLRPVGVAATIIGSALFVVSLPFSAIGGNTKNAYEKMIKEPAKYTFARPIGRY